MVSDGAWETFSLGEVAEDWKKTWKPEESEAEAVDHYSIPAFDQGRSPSRERPSDIKSNKRVVADDAVLLSRLNPATPRVWMPRLEPGRESVCSTEMLVLRPRAGVDRGFLHYLCWSPHVATALLERVSGSTGSHQRVSPRDVLSLPVPLPPIEEQRALSEMLGALDDRIDWCHDSAARIEQLILELGRGHDHDLAVSGLAAYVNGGAFTKHADGNGRLVIRIAELSSGVGPSSKYAAIEAPPDRTAYPGDILFSWSATLDVYRWTDDEALVNQHIFKVIPDEALPAWLVYAKLKEAMPTFQKIAHDRATTMGHIKRSHLDQVSVTLPSEDRLRDVLEVGNALWEQHLRINREAQVLADLRDTLLPRLLSGQLRIDDPQRLLEGVA
jgi:type I restriction enzyme, S subunit